MNNVIENNPETNQEQPKLSLPLFIFNLLFMLFLGIIYAIVLPMLFTHFLLLEWEVTGFLNWLLTGVSTLIGLAWFIISGVFNENAKKNKKTDSTELTEKMKLKANTDIKLALILPISFLLGTVIPVFLFHSLLLKYDLANIYAWLLAFVLAKVLNKLVLSKLIQFIIVKIWSK